MLGYRQLSEDIEQDEFLKLEPDVLDTLVGFLSKLFVLSAGSMDWLFRWAGLPELDVHLERDDLLSELETIVRMGGMISDLDTSKLKGFLLRNKIKMYLN